jgi:Tol biopolymer transport system component
VSSRALVRRRARTITAVLCTTTGLLGLSLAAWSGLAAATPVHVYESSFGSFGNVQGIAVDESSGDVYVYDAGTGEVLKYTAAGVPAEFSATNTNAIAGVGGAGGGEGEIAVDNSSGPAKGDIYVAHATSANVLIYNAAGLQVGELTEEAGKPWAEACGVAVDRSGNVYVGLYGSHVNKYTPTANPVTDVDYAGSLSELSGVCNIAANAAGDVYVDIWSAGPVTRYEASQFNSLEIPAVGQRLDAGGSTLAVDQSDGGVYVNEGSQVTAYDSSGGLLNAFAGSGAGAISGSRGIAVNEADSKVYVSNGSGSIGIFGEIEVEPPTATIDSATGVTANQAMLHGTVNPQGTEAPSDTEWHFEYSVDGGTTWKSTVGEDAGVGTSPVAVSVEIAGLEPSEDVETRLVAANAAGTTTSSLQTFTTPASVPVASSETPLEIATQEARLTGRIDPEGQATTYHFEYGPTIAYGTSAPVPDGEAGSGHVAVSVSAHLAGLAPGTTYHYRVVAANATGTTDGEDATFATYPVQQQAGGCANEARREEQNATHLPDCRAYEMVSPIDKNGTNIDGKGQTSEASPDGERVTYDADAGFGETNGSGIGGYTQYIASREAGGWVSHGMTPTPPQEAFQFIAGSVVIRAYSEDLRYGIVEAYALPGVSGAVPKGVNDYRLGTADGSLEAVTTPMTTVPVGATAMTTTLRGVSSGDAGVATFESPVNLLPQATGNSEKLYAWNHGELTLAGILPDGSLPAAGSSAAHGTSFNGPLTDADTLSRDGSRIVFLSPGAGGEPQLYLRRDGTSTAWVDESEATVPVAEPKEVAFQGMTPDGHKILFTTSGKLLDSDPGGAGLGLYMYTDGLSPASESNLTFIGRVEPHFETAETLKETVSAISQDGSRVYFYTESDPSFSEGGIYLWDNGAIHFVAATKTTLLQSSEGAERFVEASADGRELAFDTPEQLTDAPVGPGLGAMYLYDEESGTLRCVSCLSTGTPTTSGVEMIPRATKGFEEVGATGKPRFISSDGRFVFFATAAPLVSRDVNGVTDVYEYDSDTGNVSLLSSGAGESGTWFSNSGANGDDVFVVTKESLVASDADSLADLYDIRVGGGFPQPKPQTGGCDGDECQGTPAAVPSFNTASGFSGLGNTAAKAGNGSKPNTVTGAPKLTRAQKLKQALKTCKRKSKRVRKRCEAQARKRYGAKKARRSTSNRVGR